MTLFRFKQFTISHSRSTLKVGTDAILLGALTPIAQGSHRILDAGTGCGVIALMLAQRSQAHIVAIDIDLESVSEAQSNFEQSPWQQRLSALHSSVQGHTHNHLHCYDLVVSNPPFFSDSKLPENERLRLAKHTSSNDISTFLAALAKLIAPQGKLAVILPIATSPVFSANADKLGLYPEIVFEIIPKKGKPANRKIMVFSGERVNSTIRHYITLRNASDGFTDQYKLITKDFHPEEYLL